MSLSEHEQRLLAQMETALAAEDPDLAQKLRRSVNPHGHRRRLTVFAFAFALGLTALIVGMHVSLFLNIEGFLIMLVSVIIGVRSGNVPTVRKDPPVTTTAVTMPNRRHCDISPRRDL